MLDDLKANNRVWADRKVAGRPAFFSRLEHHQKSEYLWIGCADSRVPPNEIVGLDVGELFVHRNVANLASPQDLSYLSVLQYAVQELKVKHILVVGHHGCGGVAASVDGRRRGLVDHWLQPIRDVHRRNIDNIDAVFDQRLRMNLLADLNVIQQVFNVATDIFVQDTWVRGWELSVHGWVYSLADGLVKDLGITVSSAADLDQLMRTNASFPAFA